MRTLLSAIIFMQTFLVTFYAGASPIGDRPRIWPEFQYRAATADAPFFGAPDEAADEISEMDLLFGLLDSGRKKMEASDSSFDTDRAKISVSAFIFSYGAYLHQWNMPRFETLDETLFFRERPFDYMGPSPEPKPRPLVQPEEGRYRYPEKLMESIHVYPTGLIDAFELEYTLNPEEDAFQYPFAFKERPEPVQRIYVYGEISPGDGSGGVAYGPAVRQYGYKHFVADESKKRVKQSSKAGIGEPAKKITSGSVRDRPYAMILLGAGLAAVAALFRMFRLALFILVVWVTLYWKDLWRIIFELQ